MIGFIKGEIKKISDKEVCILTNSGIGYVININEKIYSKIFKESDIELYIYHHITENSQSLFGFLEIEEEEIFKELIKISGIGGKVAMNILGMGINELIFAIQTEDEKAIESIKGIGKRGAQKIIIEMKDKDIVKNNQTVQNNKKSENKGQDKLYSKEIFDTLVGMGFNENKVEETLINLPENIKNVEDVIPFAIKKLSS